MTPAPGVDGALKRYRAMAFVTGSFLILLTVVTAVKYIGEAAADWENESFLSVATVIGIVHGWIFMVYVVTCADLWRRMKWRLGRLLTMVLGGVVPVMSCVVERRVSREVAASRERGLQRRTPCKAVRSSSLTVALSTLSSLHVACARRACTRRSCLTP
jgi:integral membrane protein